LDQGGFGAVPLGRPRRPADLLSGRRLASAIESAGDSTGGAFLYDGPMDPLPPLPTVQTGRYRHYKGGEYEVLGTARHSETLEPMVLYRPLNNQTGMWVRPYDMFLEEVEVEGVVKPRFAKVG